MEKSPKSELHVYRMYWGKPRKSAVRSRPTAMKPSNSEFEDGFSDGKIKKKLLHCEDISEMGSEGGVKTAHKVFDDMSKKNKTEKNGSVSAISPKKYTSDLKGTAKMGSKSKMGSVKSGIDVVKERRKLLNLFRNECEYLRRQNGTLCKRIDIMAFDAVKETGNLFMTQKFFGPVPGVEVGECFEYRLELIIMGIHFNHLRGIDHTETPEGWVLATSIVATEGYEDNLMNPNGLVYTGEGGGTFEAHRRGAPKDQELKGGNLALMNSVKIGNPVRVVRGIRGCRFDRSSTVFVYDGLYKVVGSAKVLGSYGKMQFKFTLQRCPGQKPVAWGKYKRMW